MAKTPQKVLNYRSSVSGKTPTADKITYGEIAVNFASGDGASFLAFKKADDTIALIHEDEYMLNYVKTVSGSIVTELIDDEKAIAAALTQINTSAGFDRNGISQLDDEETLTDAIKRLDNAIGDFDASDYITSANAVNAIESLSGSLITEILDNEEVTVAGFHQLQSSVGLNENLQYEPIISGNTSIKDDIQSVKEELIKDEKVIENTFKIVRDNVGLDTNFEYEGVFGASTTVKEDISTLKGSFDDIAESVGLDEDDYSYSPIFSSSTTVRDDISTLYDETIINEEIIENAFETINSIVGIDDDFNYKPVFSSSTTVTEDIQNVKESIDNVYTEIVKNEKVIEKTFDAVNNSVGLNDNFEYEGVFDESTNVKEDIQNLYNEVIDDEYVTEKAVEALRDAIGLDENLSTVYDNGATTITAKINSLITRLEACESQLNGVLSADLNYGEF